MKIGIRELDGASCTISFCTGVPAKMKQDIREITHLEVPEHLRGEGRATRLLEMVCKEADKFKVILLLSPDPFGDDPSLDKKQLMEWYGTTFDFNPIQQEPLLMARMFAIFSKPILAEKVSQIITEGIK